ncbi:hypothetical protein PoMZ_08159 [Pyricularia oryzae]|uniref:Uncharacterized protein n=2 Tax=Pyricularia TaxID=48558 RepID=A0ABQ8NWP2_PYRGI|nr:hypothetical protein MCOR33_001946 [Pyricularia grisea]QBZ61211.1 hypothetical protein PoMZ_08159 [Pyricularia oryzae]
MHCITPILLPHFSPRLLEEANHEDNQLDFNGNLPISNGVGWPRPAGPARASLICVSLITFHPPDKHSKPIHLASIWSDVPVRPCCPVLPRHYARDWKPKVRKVGDRRDKGGQRIYRLGSEVLLVWI